MARQLLVAIFLISCVAAEVRRELTTRSWDAIGFHEDVKRSPLEDNIIIGVVDSGIWPESESFSDVGLGPPPQKWKGICQPNDFNFKCNNKIIGARFYIPDANETGIRLDASIDELSPRDNDGHGTHVAATVAGVPVKGVSVKGLGLGTARGAMPRARIAVYKTCWNSNGGKCYLPGKAIEDAINDGVDIITISIGGKMGEYYYRDEIAMSSVNAMRHGILVSLSAGNSGPDLFSLENVTPWTLTVGNSFTGPEYASFVKLGNGKTIKGQLSVDRSQETLFPLVGSLEVSKVKEGVKLAAETCLPDYLDSELARGKIVLCPSVPMGKFNFGNSTAAGIIFDAGNNYENLKAGYSDHSRVVPIVGVTSEDYAYLVGYLKENGTASILKSEEIKVDKPAAATAAMSSSRGPNVMDSTIMKPDLCAPGVNIIAASIGNSTSFDSFTGTSMAAPHASGIAGYVKSFRPEWSPSAIKSALITTATPMVNDATSNVSELAYGAGNLNPIAAVDPGLIYDLEYTDYIKYLCQWSKFEDYFVSEISRDPNATCSIFKMEDNWSLNLPTFSIPAQPNTPFVKVFRRSVKNVGTPISNYKAIVSAPPGVEIQLQPNVLSFEKADQVLFYDVTIKGQIPNNSTTISASFVWTDGHHQVRSPIIIIPGYDRDEVYEQIHYKA